MVKLLEKKKKNLSIITQPWFVVIVVISCFGILTPKIFMPLFRQLTGSRNDHVDRTTNNMRMRPMAAPQAPQAESGDFSRGGPQFGRQAPTYGGQTGGSSSKSLLTFLLPVYATGIGIYMVYTLFKVFNKNDEKKEVDEEEDFENNKKNNYKFLEKDLNTNVRWDADEGEFKYVDKVTNHFNMSEESEDELNNYERYKNLDPDYVEYLKEKRRIKKEECKKASLASTTKASLKSDEIHLSPGSGITSITNTNVLMNDTLERMKYSLNKINNQLIDVEKKGGPLDDPELENLRFQLTQTELQMAKIMNIVNTVSSTIHENSSKIKQQNEDQENNDIDNDEEIEDLHRQVELIKQVVNKSEKNKKCKNKRTNKNVYEKIKLNINAAEQLLRNRRKLVQDNELQQMEVDNFINEKLGQTASKSPESLSASSSSSETASSSLSCVSSERQSDCEKEQITSNETDEEIGGDDHLNDDDDDDDVDSDSNQSDIDTEQINQKANLKNKDV